jgi:hypothetical protein
MSRKIIFTLAAAATFAVAGLASNTSYARGFVGGHAFGGGFGGGRAFAGGGRTFGRVGGPIGRGPISRIRITGNPGRHPIFNVPGRNRPVHPPIIIGLHPHHHHFHWALRGGRWIEVDDVAVDTVDVAPAVVSTPAPVSVPGPCTCLTKTYTPTGLVVFADVCTKESASAPATDDTADASQAPTSPVAATATPMSQVPTTPNYAGRTYTDYLAANPQFAQPQVSTQAPAQTPTAPKQN